MSESFPKGPLPSAEVMREDIYKAEQKRITDRIDQIDTHLDELFRQEHAGEVPENSINPEVNLLNATKSELEKQLEALQERHEHGR